MTAKENTIVIKGPNKESYSEVDLTGVNIPVHIESRVYVVNVDMLLEDGVGVGAPFGRPEYILLFPKGYHKTSN